jgi:hypothetical protein
MIERNLTKVEVRMILKTPEPKGVSEILSAALWHLPTEEKILNWFDYYPDGDVDCPVCQFIHPVDWPGYLAVAVLEGNGLTPDGVREVCGANGYDVFASRRNDRAFAFLLYGGADHSPDAESDRHDRLEAALNAESWEGTMRTAERLFGDEDDDDGEAEGS